MTTRRSGAATALSTSDIEEIRGGLAAGRKPKVMFTAAAGQIAGEVGQVVELTDPAASDEWVVVRFGRDELPFSPSDLAMPPRGRAAKATEPRPAVGKATGATVPAPRPAAAPKTSVATPRTSDAAAKTSEATPKDSEATPMTEDATLRTADASANGAEADGQARPAKRAAKSARASKPKPPAALTVTLAYDSGEWTVAAQQGNKTLAKPYMVRPAEALKLVGMVDVPGVHEAVEAIVAAEVAEAAQRAEQLRTELAEVEARLADLRDAG